MNSRIVFVNIILVFILVIEIFTIIRLWSQQEVLPASYTGNAVKAEKFRNIQLFQAKNIPLSAYNDITRKNLFALERKEYIPEAKETEPEIVSKSEQESEIEKLNTSQITLFGIIIAGKLEKALVSDVDRISNRKSIWVEKGDKISNFMVSTIEKDRVILTKSGKKYSILLYDKQNPKKRKIIKIKPVNRKNAVISKSAKPERPSKSIKPKASIKKDDKDYDTISTPFGDFKRKKKK